MENKTQVYNYILNAKTGLKLASKKILSVLIIFALFCGLLFIAQDSLIFHNVHCHASREFLQNRPGFREIKFTALSGNTYHGMMRYISDEEAPLLIYFGGNGEVSYRHMRMREMNNHWQYFDGFHYLFVDYRGYGLNSGRTHYRNMQEQALAIFDYAAALANVDGGRIVVMGYSLGTASAVYLAANRPAAGLILATPFSNGYDLYNNLLPIFRGPMRFLVRQKLPSYRYAPYVACPVLIIASRNDEIIPFSSTQRLASLFPGDVDFMELSNARHNDIFLAHGVYDRVRDFLGDFLY